MTDYHKLEGGVSENDKVPLIVKKDDQPTVLTRQ